MWPLLSAETGVYKKAVYLGQRSTPRLAMCLLSDTPERIVGSAHPMRRTAPD